jgi:Bacterial extracellular solute-binding protein
MTRFHRLTAVLVGVALASLSLAACGGDDDDGGNGGDQAGGETQYADLSGQNVEVVAAWTGQEQASFEQVLAAFKEKTNANTRYTSAGNNAPTVLGTRIEGGNPPEVAILPNPGLLNQFAGQDALTAANEAVTAEVDKNYAEVWKTLGTVEGTLYGVWFKAANKSTVWYSTQAFEDAGVEEPATWDDFLAAAQTIADSGVTPVSIGGGDGWVLTDWFENIYLRVAGPEKYDQLAAHEIPWTDESVKTTLDTLAQLWSKPDLIVGGANGALQTPFPQSVANVFGSNPKGAMVYEGDFVASEITNATDAEVGTDAKFFNFPAVNDSPTSVVGGGDVAVAMKPGEASQELLKFLATPEAAEIWAKRGGYTSANKELSADVYPDDIARKSADALVNSGDAFRFDLSDLTPAAFGGTPGAGMWKILQDFLKNPSDVAGTQQKLEDAAAKAYGS